MALVDSRRGLVLAASIVSPAPNVVVFLVDDLDDVQLGVKARFPRVHATGGPGPALTLRELAVLEPPVVVEPTLE